MGSRTVGRRWLLAGGALVGLLGAACGTIPGVHSQTGMAAQSDLTNGLNVVAAQYAANNFSYEAVNAELLVTVAPEFSWTADGPTVGAGFNAISVDSCADGRACQAILLASYNRLGDHCWYGATANSGQAASALGLPGEGTYYGLRRRPQTCSAGTEGHPTVPPSGWQTTFSLAESSG